MQKKKERKKDQLTTERKRSTSSPCNKEEKLNFSGEWFFYVQQAHVDSCEVTGRGASA